ncbi:MULTISPECIES: outer membrane protein assembly factor BamE [unclassified Janthinobacterium]|uniref:outer membrane protein assembly factor BamE domain-containing protein n=1 Tax=unclassified Janthinobacterium TaxID=2610881 RepID=UPI00087F8ED8|nr:MULTISPECIES: outer membrane protein assembly factor BamE [unclassified Janthinobacterium]SDA41131.1 SmpA / OmlA family protein [Janthinobacterium sp. 551a]SFA85219.1 SmpA / OmlA family protein [Janthinobacterium sp. 344]
MKNILKLATPMLFAALAGCASWNVPPPQPGEPRAAVEARLGRPTNVYQLPTGPELEYATGPYGQATYMARFGPDDKLISYEQVLDTAGFARVKVGVSTEQDVLHLLGRPTETSYLSIPKLHVWSYRYKESGVWDSMMHVHFDQDGIVRMMMNGPDPAKEERRFFW